MKTSTTGQIRNKRGMALVIVIGLLSLLTLLALALLARSHSARQRTDLEASTEQGKALAQTAFQTVLAGLHDEMVKGSSKVTVNQPSVGTKLYDFDLSSSRSAVRPSISLIDPIKFKATSLVKQSNALLPFHSFSPGRTPRSSSVPAFSSGSPHGSEFWNAPRLLPAGVDFSASNSPTWTYLTRSGTSPSSFSAPLVDGLGKSGTANQSFVIGRYAYNLYDLSGTLDINAAGYSIAKAGGKLAPTKGSLAFADLSKLPGMNETIADALADWKHTWGKDDEDYIRRAEGAGWMSLAGNDNLFLSRQDLLRFGSRYPGAMSPQALPYLTHFSRALDAPSFRPHPNRRKVELSAAQGGNDAKGLEDELNPPLTNYRSDRKRMLLDRKFPLQRLEWVATPGTAGPADAALAERYFGLKWTGTIWEYVHARSNGDLYTLQDVPADREPNFFEILRASVNVGSLGRQYAARGFDPNGPSKDLEQWSHRLPGGGRGGLDASVNRNILELGACIIDQYDRDSYPSAIRIKGAPTNQIVYGKEDVPYLAKTLVTPYRGRKLGVPVYNDDKTVAHNDSFEVNMTLQVGIWRPHQPVAASDYNGPSKFRIRPSHIDPFGGSLFWLMGGWNVPNPTVGKPNGSDPNRAGDYTYWGGPNYRVTNPELFPKTFSGNASESITVSFDHASTAFREPQTVHSPAHASLAGYSVSGSTVDIKPGDLRWHGLPATDQVSGFLVGKAMTARGEPGAKGSRMTQGWFTGQPLEFILEYEAPGGNWRPYQQVESTYQSTWSGHYQVGQYWDTASWIWTSLLIDPRTNRFGGIGGTGQSWTHNNNPEGAPQSGPNAFSPRLHWPEGAALRWETSKTISFDGSNIYSGVWSWWRAPAPGSGWNFNGNVEWWMNFQHAGCLDNNLDAWNSPFTLAFRDPDGVLRPGVGADIEYGKSGAITGNPMSRRHSITSNGKLSRTESLSGRPVVLNRPFRSVGELAHAFRGTPWKDIDFLNPSSPDAALLDVFRLYEYPDPTVTDTDPVVAGRVNLNSAGPEVLKALFSGALIDDRKGDPGSPAARVFPDSQAQQLAQAFHDWTHSTQSDKGPLLSMADLVQAYDPAVTSDRVSSNPGLARTLSELFTDSVDRSINDRREAALRALSGGTTVRSWTFMLDLVVQSGTMRRGASSLEDFNSKSEQRFWVHFSMDRFTGKILDVQWEQVFGLPDRSVAGP